MKERNYFKSSEILFSYSNTKQVYSKDFERHCHSDYELLFVYHGTGNYIVEGVKYPLKQDSMMVFRPNEYHYVCPEEGTSYERLVINFQPTLLTETATAKYFFNHNKKTAGSALYFADDLLDSSVKKSLEIAIWAVRKKNAENIDDEIVKSILSCTISQILLTLSTDISIQKSQKDTGTEVQIISYLNEHLTESFSLKELAKQFLISDSYLCKIFRNITGLTVHEYVNIKRITLAKELLSQGVPATEVAYQTGFSDYSTFYRTYKKIAGESPKRKNETP